MSEQSRFEYHLHTAKILVQLAKRDFLSKYVGSYLGIIWGFIQPAMTILILWFVFQVGFKQMPVQDVPFILWLMCGMVPWFFFQEAVSGGTAAIVDHGYLVKQVVFRFGFLPIVRIMSAAMVHAVFVVVLLLLFMAYGYNPTLHALQLFYYFGAMSLFIMGLTWFTSALVVFAKDVGQLIATLLQIWFWITPIFWPLAIIPERYQLYLKANPLYYIVNGYREALIDQTWFWSHPRLGLGYWCVTLGLLGLGIFMFKRLRPHIPDVI